MNDNSRQVSGRGTGTGMGTGDSSRHVKVEEKFLPDIADGEDKNSPLANRIRKNYRHIRKWAKRTSTNCFRIYDRDIRQFPVAIDFYNGRFCLHYFSPVRDQEEPPEKLVEDITRALCMIFGEQAKNALYWRTRAKNKETRQYEKANQSEEFFIVQEYGLKFLVNLTDYLDTGLFLDHRETRHLVAQQASGKKVLNLFAYTCAFSVHAAAGGANYTKSIDMSNTYTAWGRDNFELNGLAARNNEIVRADCLKFLDEETMLYDLIILDPPTISRSKKMDTFFNIQDHYIPLIQKCLRLLTSQGKIFFSTNSRRFSFDTTTFSNCVIREITEKTLPIDFHDPKIHKCWEIIKGGIGS